MTHYSNDPSMVRVDFFKPRGKWYATEEMVWPFYTGEIHSILRNMLNEQLRGRYIGMTAVCLEPYHEHAHPVMIQNVGQQNGLS